MMNQRFKQGSQVAGRSEVRREPNAGEGEHQIQPASSRRTTASMTRRPAGLELRHGM